MAMSRQELLEYQKFMKQDVKNQMSFFAFYWLAGILSALIALSFNKLSFYPLCPIFWFLAGMHKEKASHAQNELSNILSIIHEKESCHDA